ncbi:hypothetical protein V8F06_012167 [Rhypophila decipiens]
MAVSGCKFSCFDFFVAYLGLLAVIWPNLTTGQMAPIRPLYPLRAEVRSGFGVGRRVFSCQNNYEGGTQRAPDGPGIPLATSE